MGLSFEFQEQLRAIEESIKPVDLTSEISQYQDEVREGYVPEKKATPEADARFRQAGMAKSADFARKLERERDESRSLLARCSAEREHNAMQALVYKAERDEAAKQLEAMREAIREAHALCKSAERDHNIDGEYAMDCLQFAIAKLQPFLP